MNRLAALAFALLLAPIACFLSPQQAVTALVTAEQIACIIEHATLDDPTIAKVCAVAQSAIPQARETAKGARLAKDAGATDAR